MFTKRFLKVHEDYSILLFGARGVGKSSLLEVLFDFNDNLYINLLDPLEEARFARNPNELISLVDAMEPTQHYVIIDEVQKGFCRNKM